MEERSKGPRSFISSREIRVWGVHLPVRDLLCLLVIFTAFLLNNGLWLARDKLNPVADEAVYLSRSLEVFESLQEDLASWSELYWQRFEVRPTFFFVAPSTIAYGLFGTWGDVAILATNGLAALVLIVALYLLGRHFFDSRAGLLAAFLVLCYPRVGIISRTYWPHFSTLPIAALGTWLLFVSDSLKKKRHLFAFGCVLGVGLMIRPIYPALLLFTAACWSSGAAVIEELSRSSASRSGWRFSPSYLARAAWTVAWRWWPAVIPPVVIAGPYYYRFLPSMLEHIRNWQEMYIGQWPYRPSLFWYLEGLPGDMGFFFFGIFLLGLASCLRSWRSTAPILACFAGTWTLISLSKVKFFYYFASIYPLIALLSACGLAAIRHRRLRNLVTVATVLVGSWLAVSAAWELKSPVLQTLLHTRSNGPEQEEWRIQRVCRKIETLHTGNDRPVVGFIARSQIFDAASFQYLCHPVGLDAEYRSVHQPIKTLFEADFVVVEPHPDSSLRALPSRRRKLGRYAVENPQGTFWDSHHKVLYVGPRERPKLVLYQRERKWTAREVLELGAELLKAEPEVAGKDLVRWIRRLPPKERKLLTHSALEEISKLEKRGRDGRAARFSSVARLWIPADDLGRSVER